jgi:putative serine/threonine protein kinase
MEKVVPLVSLEKEGYAWVICYPKADSKELTGRLAEMGHLGVEALCFRGNKKVHNTQVLGKGYVGIVVLARTGSGLAALKIRRTDSGRAGMRHEAEILQKVNSVDVGPKLLGYSEDCVLMEFVDGTPFPNWIKDIGETKHAQLKARKVVKEILEQCWRLDEIGVDHGELSKAPKHIIVRDDREVCILDFETASVQRKVSNVTSVCNYLFMRGTAAETIRKKLVDVKTDSLLKALREYKGNRTREHFERILDICSFWES